MGIHHCKYKGYCKSLETSMIINVLSNLSIPMILWNSMKTMGSFINVPIKCFISEEEKEHKPQKDGGLFHLDCFVQELLRRNSLAKFLYLLQTCWKQY